MALNLTFSTVGDCLAKVWGVTDNRQWLYIGLVVNLFTMYFFMAAIKEGGLAVTTAVVLLLTIVLNVVFGVAVFRGKVAPLQWVGVALGMTAIALILGVGRTRAT